MSESLRGVRAIALVPNRRRLLNFLKPDYVDLSVTKGASKTILFIGRFERQKNLDTLIEAASQVAKDLPIGNFSGLAK